ncbi:hypothetical protein P12x_005600 [Tundrisphaera lichenicola]|uniref:hypothetical protein n=1 Tax=Tundrisphaera lichenicola TaxID=2029860 RepID=UPI003EBC89EA
MPQVRASARAVRPGAGLTALALAAGLLAALAAGLGGEATSGTFQPPNRRPANFEQLDGYARGPALSEMVRQERPPTEAKNTALAYGLLGVALGGALGLAGGLAGRSSSASLKAGLIGAILGGAVGALASWPMTLLFYRNLDPESGVLLPLLIRGGIWLPIGAAAGLAFGVGLGGSRSIVAGLLGGLVGAVIGTVAFELISVAGFPLVRLTSPIPGERTPRLLAVFCVAAGTALGTALGSRDVAPKPKPDPLA